MASAPPTIVRTVQDLRAQVAAWRATGERVALVPTMGALHEGHMSLARLARTQAERIVVSIFVNPRQFAPGEDFDAYPRGEPQDVALLAAEGCDLLFAPAASAMYAPGFSTTVSVSGVSEPLEGESRPQFFAGVATVVAKLLIQCAPDVAVFGETDYQQLQVIRRLVLELVLPIRILGAPTARAVDGLALSSRNAYLSADQRIVAGRLNRVLNALAQAVARGERVAEAEARALADLLAAGFDRVDYIQVRAADDLRRLGPGPIDAPARVLAAAWLGRTRLIDNMAAQD